MIFDNYCVLKLEVFKRIIYHQIKLAFYIEILKSSAVVNEYNK